MPIKIIRDEYGFKISPKENKRLDLDKILDLYQGIQLPSFGVKI